MANRLSTHDPDDPTLSIACTFTLKEVREAGWIPPGIAAELRELVGEGKPWPPERKYVAHLLGVHLDESESMIYDGTLDSYAAILAWAKEKGDTTALANEWRFMTPIIVFPGGQGRFWSVDPGDVVIYGEDGFTVRRGTP